MSETWKHNTKKRFFDSLKTRAIILLITFGFFGLILALNYLTTGDIKDVLISGGMSHTPLLKRTFELYFKNPNLINDDGSKIKPSEAIALGCAKQAGILCVLSSLSGQANVDRESIEKNLTGEV